jgi:Fur family ferric uptake transcriptional regulator
MNRNNLANAFARLQAEGHRLTRPRRQILERLFNQRRSTTASELHQELGDRDVSLASVYRTLELLVELGLAETTAHSGAEHQYLACSLEHHHHIICDRCGMVAELEECALAPIETMVASQSGFAIDGHTLEFHGRCASCQA